ncbi:hydantoinase [Sodiomyces alkalinus F11]|uniref:Hydantoinase n=1 Tax=Sodiomyces alkalinus (strain CBS 110278 / VKM F-3762 / F11) TaxID=1314773 RepID=A0A3N2PUM7_SODAK|nr:hydantoinase [Sodiomyces alkalinus F11]ROT38213.1 hydantoinase [Sodiomyces alkalinus F11]
MVAKSQGPLIVGVDVGGTNTDAVLLDLSLPGPSAVLSSQKSPTTPDVTQGLQASLLTLLSKPFAPAPSAISALAIGTTHFLNAILQRDATRLSRVAVLRLGSHGFLDGALPFADWPTPLRRIIEGHSAVLPGGVNIDGRLIAPLDEAALRHQAREVHRRRIRSVVIVGMGSPADRSHDQEARARDVFLAELRRVNPGYALTTDVVLSHTVAGSGLLARENAAILNAAILPFARRTLHALTHATRQIGLRCPLYLTSNAGHLLPFSEAVAFPVRIFSSGPTNSMRGAAFLVREDLAAREGACGGGTCIVVDVGGTTSDAGALLPNGYPRLSRTYSDLGGVKVNLDMPSVESVALGGGSIVRVLEDGHATTGGGGPRVTIGPDSVGSALMTRALCFGGVIRTATDIAVASSLLTQHEDNDGDGDHDGDIAPVAVGNPSLVAIPREVVSSATASVRRKIESLIDSVKLSPDPCTVVLVGGGAILLSPATRREGVDRIIRPAHAGVANAVGAALAKIYGTAEAMVDAEDVQAGILQVKKQAVWNAVSKGGVEGQVTVLSETVEWVPYIDGKKLVRVQVACPADHATVYEGMLESGRNVDGISFEFGGSPEEVPEPATCIQDDDAQLSRLRPLDQLDQIDVATYRPQVLSSGEWVLSATDLKFLEIGCYILGCGGGGSPYASYLHLLECLRQGERITICRPEDLRDDDVLPPVAAIGTPAVGLERIASNAVFHALQRLREEVGGVEYTHILATEIGGMNGLGTLIWGAQRYCGLSIVDGDLMGRAFPNFEMVSQYVSAESINELLPVAICSGDGRDAIVLAGQEDETAAGKEIRRICAEFGFAAGASGTPLSGRKMREAGIPNSFSLAWRLGRAVRRCQLDSTLGTVADALIDAAGGDKSARTVFSGKIRGVETRITETGHSLGEVVVERLAEGEMEDEGLGGKKNGEDWTEVRVPFMNENLAVVGKGADGEKVLATVPDLIILLDASSGEAIGVQEYRYGVKVTIVIMAPHPVWTSKRGLEIVGPSAFGLPYEYAHTLNYTKPKSVIDEYGVS